MRVARVVGAIGKLMMSAGLILLLFVVYQLWGTGVYTSGQQDRLEEEFAALGAESTAPTDTTDTTASTTATTTADTTPTATDPSTTADTLPVVTAPPSTEVLEIGAPIGRIEIPKISSSWMMIEGVPLSQLKNGPGHFPGTPLPGQPGNSAIAGHRTTYGAPFNRIDELVEGDDITVETHQGTFTYKVVNQPTPEGGTPSAHVIVKPWETAIIENTLDNRITIVACHPEYSARLRIVVQGVLVGQPAPETPGVSVIPPKGEEAYNAMMSPELPGGDSSAWPGFIGFAIASIGIWLGAWLVARRWTMRNWRWWATYAVAVVPFGVLLFLTFEQVNRLLPAAY